MKIGFDIYFKCHAILQKIRESTATLVVFGATRAQIGKISTKNTRTIKAQKADLHPL